MNNMDPLNMTLTHGNNYQTTISEHEKGTWVRYNIAAYDNAGNLQTARAVSQEL